MNQNTSPSNSPWKGLDFYSEKDKDIFFGRAQETEELLRLVQRDILTVLFARSGLGKSSLLRAGLSPRLRELNFLPILVRCDYSAAALPPVEQIISAVLSGAAAAEIEVDAADDSEQPSAPGNFQGTLWEFFHSRRLWSPRNDPVTPILIIDQFEEIFTLGQQTPYATDFIAQLADLAENRMPKTVQSRLGSTGERLTFDTRTHSYKIILALREDYVPKLDSLRPLLPAIMRNRYELTLLSSEHALDVVLKAGGQWVSDAVAREIVTAVAGKDESAKADTPPQLGGRDVEPAYLSVMCDELYRRMVAQNRTAIDSSLVLEERGKILDTFYERSFSDLNAATRFFVEDRLLTHSGFRSSIPLAEATEEGVSRADLESLVKSRLLRMEDRLGTTHVELGHDLLAPIVRKSRDARRAIARAEEERARERQKATELGEKLRRERRRLQMALATVVVLVGAIGFVLYGWVLPYDSYCRDFSKRWGRIHPVGALSASDAGHRQSTLRLTQKGWFGPVVTVTVINAGGELAANSPIISYLSGSEQSAFPRKNVARIELEQNRLGRVVSEIAFDRFDRMIWGFVYVPDKNSGLSKEQIGLAAWIERVFEDLRGNADRSKPRVVKAMFLGADGYPQPQGHSRAEFVEIRYDERGFETELRYQDREGLPMPGPDAAFGRRQEYDRQGRIVRIMSLDERGSPMNDEVGNAGLELSYEETRNDSRIEQKAFDVNGEATLVEGGYYRLSTHYDQFGRITENRFFNLSDEPVEESKGSGAHRMTWQYDDRGNATSIKLYDKSNKPLIAGEFFFDFAAHEQRATFNANNRAEKVAYFDTDGNGMSNGHGWQEVRYSYDQNGFVSEIAYFGKAGEKVGNVINGYHRWILRNDAYGQPTEERFFSADGRPVEFDYHLRRNAYDRAGNLISQSFFDAHDQPVTRSETAHRVETTYDRFRNPVLIQYFDAAEQPADNKHGFSKIVSSYDEYGSKLSTRWYDSKNQPVKGPDGAHETRNSYDKRGLLVTSAHFDAAGRAAIDSNGVHEAIYIYNPKRQEWIRQFFGLKRQPAEDNDGNHLIVHEFDIRGRKTRITQLRADCRPNLDAELEIATVTYVYDKEGNWIEQAFYDRRHHLVVGPYGYAEARREVEADGRSALVFYGADGKFVFNPLQGFASKKVAVSAQGDRVDSYHDSNGQLMTGPEGYAEARSHRDDHNNLTSIAYFGPDKLPVAGPKGFHRAEQPAFDAATRYYAADGSELSSLGPETIAPLIVVSEILGVRQAAAKAGMQAGDILWRYGEWSYAQILADELAKGTEFSVIPGQIAKTFLAERDRLSSNAVAITVIRHGQQVRLTVPPTKKLGVELADRAVPIATLESWRKASLTGQSIK